MSEPATVKIVVDPLSQLIGMTIAEHPQLALTIEGARDIARVLLQAASVAEQLNEGTMQ